MDAPMLWSKMNLFLWITCYRAYPVTFSYYVIGFRSVVTLGIFSPVSVFRDLETPGDFTYFAHESSSHQQQWQNLCFGRGPMALSPGWRAFALFPGTHCGVFLKALRSSGLSSFPWGHCPWGGPGSSLDPEMKVFLEENTEVTSSGSLTPEIRLRLLTPRCKFWWERADLWPHSDPYWAIYWPGGQALSRYCSNWNGNL